MSIKYVVEMVQDDIEDNGLLIFIGSAWKINQNKIMTSRFQLKRLLIIPKTYY